MKINVNAESIDLLASRRGRKSVHDEKCVSHCKNDYENVAWKELNRLDTCHFHIVSYH